ELLNWAGATPDTSTQLIPALDDADHNVRASVARYLFPRLETLPDDFPFQDLLEALSRQLNRPSHQDRSKALYCLLALCKQHPDLTRAAKVFDEDRVKQLAQESTIPAIKEPAVELSRLFAKTPSVTEHMPPKPDGSHHDAEGSGFF
ncbi:MAG: hypothetical protein HY711_10140, partial [Candidatus Melainabacteria bacterium]|nr:hypothetical protein [Candidatus Melainabacteria bacterium]